jgi:DNA polymerase III delta subunit
LLGQDFLLLAEAAQAVLKRGKCTPKASFTDEIESFFPKKSGFSGASG